MKLLGHTLTKEEEARFREYDDYTYGRQILSIGDFFLHGIFIFGAVFYPYYDISHTIVFWAYMALIGFLLAVVHNQFMILAGRLMIRPHRHLVMGNPALDWPFGPRHRMWMFRDIFLNVATITAFYFAGWNWLVVMVLVSFAISQFSVWQKAHITRKALDQKFTRKVEAEGA